MPKGALLFGGTRTIHETSPEKRKFELQADSGVANQGKPEIPNRESVLTQKSTEDDYRSKRQLQSSN
jgi:hypothetical protein